VPQAAEQGRVSIFVQQSCRVIAVRKRSQTPAEKDSDSGALSQEENDKSVNKNGVIMGF